MSYSVQFRSLAIAALICSFASLASAQSEDHDVGISSVRAQHGISLGFEFGYGADYQQGSFPSSGFFDGLFDNGKGSGLMGAIFFEMPVSRSFSVGLRAGINSESTSQTQQKSESAIVVDPDTIMNVLVNQTADVDVSYLSISPQIYFRPFETGLFLSVSPALSILLSSRYSQTQNFPSTTTIEGIPHNLRFSNGAGTETLQYGQLPDANSIRFSALFSLGYDLPVGNVTIAPIVTYDYPFTTVRNTNENNWKIASLYGSLGLKFKL